MKIKLGSPQYTIVLVGMKSSFWNLQNYANISRSQLSNSTLPCFVFYG